MLHMALRNNLYKIINFFALFNKYYTDMVFSWGWKFQKSRSTCANNHLSHVWRHPSWPKECPLWCIFSYMEVTSYDVCVCFAVMKSLWQPKQTHPLLHFLNKNLQNKLYPTDMKGWQLIFSALWHSALCFINKM